MALMYEDREKCRLADATAMAFIDIFVDSGGMWGFRLSHRPT
jgi:hypothetical protein